MKAGHQNHSSDAELRVLAAFGVNHICSSLPSRKFDANWSVEGLTRLRERVESCGVKLDMVPLPLSSSYISRAENPHIMMGKSPERDREIDDICAMMRNVARVGIPAVSTTSRFLVWSARSPHAAEAAPATAPSTIPGSSKSRRPLKPAL